MDWSLLLSALTTTRPFSTTIAINLYQNVSIMDFIRAKDDGGGGDNWSYKTCKVLANSSSTRNQHPSFTGRMRFLSPNQVSKHWMEKYHIPWICSPQTHLWSSNLVILTIKGSELATENLQSLLSAFWCQYSMLSNTNCYKVNVSINCTRQLLQQRNYMQQGLSRTKHVDTDICRHSPAEFYKHTAHQRQWPPVPAHAVNTNNLVNHDHHEKLLLMKFWKHNFTRLVFF